MQKGEVGGIQRRYSKGCGKGGCGGNITDIGGTIHRNDDMDNGEDEEEDEEEDEASFRPKSIEVGEEKKQYSSSSK